MTSEEAIKIIAGEVVTQLPHVPREQIGRTTRLVDLGADSLDRSEIVQQSMRKVGVRLRPSELMSGENLGDLADLLARASLND